MTNTDHLNNLAKAEALLLDVIKDFQGLMDRTLDGYNEGWLEKDIMEEMMARGVQTIKTAKKEIVSIEELRKTLMEQI
jgi:hypothetical protein